ncbi:hypothetical protein ACEPAF_1841 [Sanghuangporus sanghuang]
MYPHKRKRTGDNQPEPHWLAVHKSEEGVGLAQAFHVDVHEADLVIGKEDLALRLEAPDDANAQSTNLTRTDASDTTRASGLIKLDEDNRGESDVLVDRFDARLLLADFSEAFDSQAAMKPEPESPLSSSGWSDLPSDTEDAFYLSPSEVADVRFTKRRRVLEEARIERLAALRAAGDESVSSEDADPWGGSDEEPDAAQILLMERTAAHLQTSPDRTRLTARILANHGADRRFAFLRGRWSRAWVRAKAKAAAAATQKEDKEKTASRSQLTGLADYGDSDEDET